MEKSVNVGTIVGELVEVNLKVDESVVNKNNSKIKGAIVKEDFKNPSLTLLVNGNVIGVNFFPCYTKIEKDGVLKDNPNYATFEKLLTMEKGTRLMCKGCSLELNEYYDTNGKEHKKFPQINAFTVATTNVPDEDIADFKLSGVIKSIAPIVVNEEETGDLKVEFLYIKDGGQNVGLAIKPIELTVDKEMADDFTDMFQPTDCCELDIEVITETVGTAPTQTKGFGRRSSKVVSGFTRTIYNIFNSECDAPFEEEHKNYISVDDVKKLLKERDMFLEEMKNNALNKNKDNSSAKKGIGARASKVADDEVDPFA